MALHLMPWPFTRASCHGPCTPEGAWMRGKMREGSAAKAEAPQKIDDDQLSRYLRRTRRKGACLPITPVQIVIRYECLRSPISMCGGHIADRWTPSTPRWRGPPLMQALLHCPSHRWVKWNDRRLQGPARHLS